MDALSLQATPTPILFLDIPHEAPQELAFLQASKLYHQDFIFNIYSSFMCKGRALNNYRYIFFGILYTYRRKGN